MKTPHFQRIADSSPRARPMTRCHPAVRIKAAALLLLLALVLLPSAALAQDDLPRKAPLGKYAGLWTNSPFTSRPVIETPEVVPEVNPLEDYALTGVSPISGGFRVTLINRNDPEERITVDSSEPGKNTDFKVVEINRSPGRPLSTTVTLASGNVTGTVAFEQELLALKPPPAAAAAQPNNAPNATPAQAGQPQQPQAARRQPRPRVVPPPAAKNNNNNARNQRANRQRADRRRRR